MPKIRLDLEPLYRQRQMESRAFDAWLDGMHDELGHLTNREIVTNRVVPPMVIAKVAFIAGLRAGEESKLQRPKPLALCTRCRRGKCEKCVDQGLLYNEPVTVSDITCACRCFTGHLYLARVYYPDSTPICEPPDEPFFDPRSS